MEQNTKYLLQNHLYWAENQISKEEIYETCKNVRDNVFCNAQIEKIQESLNYKLPNKDVLLTSDYEKIIFIWTHLLNDKIDLSFLKYCTNLEEININCYNEANLDFLKYNTKLKKIIANDNKITNIEALYNHIDLESLNIENNPCYSIKPIAHLKKIKELELELIDDELDILNVFKNNPICKASYIIKGGETDFENFIFPFYNIFIMQNEAKVEISLEGINEASKYSSGIDIPEYLLQKDEYLEKRSNKLFEEVSYRLEKITNKPVIIDNENTYCYCDSYHFNYVFNFK